MAKQWANSRQSCSSLAYSSPGGSVEGSGSLLNTILAGVRSSWPNIKSAGVQEVESCTAEWQARRTKGRWESQSHW